MMWFFAVLIVLALGGVALVAAGRGEPLADVYDDRPDVVLPADGPVTADALRRVRFPLAFRGYRMQEVDALLDRVAAELEERDAAEPGADPAAEPEVKPEVGPAVGSAVEPEVMSEIEAPPADESRGERAPE